MYLCLCVFFFFFKQKTAYEMRISDWSSDVCSSDLTSNAALAQALEVADAGGPLTPVLAAAERKRAEYEDFTQQRRLAAEQLDQIAAEASALDRRHQRLDDEDASNVTSWREVMDEAGLQLDIVTCGAVLELLDDLRGAIAEIGRAHV